MKLSRLAKILLFAAVVVSVLAYLVIVDLGINAGRIHYGVEVEGGLDIGGMTAAEADDVLEARADAMARAPITLAAEGISVSFYPRLPVTAPDDELGVGWFANRPETIAAALDVGRDGGPLRAVLDRATAWVAGVKVAWKGRPTAFKVSRLLDVIENRADQRGYELDRTRLRIKIRRVLNTWPRKDFYRIPLS